jgi:hypothetical protein
LLLWHRRGECSSRSDRRVACGDPLRLGTTPCSVHRKNEGPPQEALDHSFGRGDALRPFARPLT